jgi:tetratricopeptide (TPR) repeat protein
VIARTASMALALLVAPVFAERLHAGERAPGLRLKGPSGETVRFEPPKEGTTTKGVTVVIFVRPDQEASRSVLREVRTLLEAEKKLAQEVRTIAVASGELTAENVAQLRASLPADGPIAAALDPDRKVRLLYGVIAIPTTFVVGRDGEIASVDPGRSAAYRVRLLASLRRCLGIAVEEEPQGMPASKRAGRSRNLAESLISKGRLEEAAALLEKARSDAPDDAALLVLLGQVRLLLEQGDAAAGSFRAALKAVPDSRPARAGLAMALSLGEPTEEAEKRLRKEAVRPHSDPDLYYYLGRLLERRGDHQKAAEAYRRAYERLKRTRR